MSARRRLRLHTTDGRVITEPLTRTARANGLTGETEARELVAEWVRAGDLRERPDGGYDVIRQRPRPDPVRVVAMRRRLTAQRRALDNVPEQAQPA